MKTKFGAGETPAETPVEATVIASETSQAVATVPSPRNNFVLGDYLPSFDQVVLPRINVAQNIGQLQDTFDSGTIVLARQTVLFLPPDIDLTTGTVRRTATPPAIMTVLGFRKTRFVEKTKGGAKGLIVQTEQDVVRAG